MRTGLVLVATLAACDGPIEHPLVDAAMEEPPPDAEIPIDAMVGIHGTWLDTYFTSTGTTALSVCGTAPTAVVVDPTTAMTTPYPGACKPDGSFFIDAPGNLGTYYLRVQGALYETTKHTGLDLSTDHLGRSDVAGISGVKLAFDLTNLDTWSTGDVLMAFAPNIGFARHVSFESGGPTNGATTLTGTSPWFGYQVDAAKSDVVQIVQLGTHTTGSGHSYLSLDRAYDIPAFTMASNATHDVTGSFTTPPAATLALNVDVASFHQFATVANPGAVQSTIAGSAYAAASPDVIPSPSLISFARDSSSTATMDFGTLGYGDPFPAEWDRYVKIQEAFAVPYTWNNVTSTLNAQMTRVMTKAEAEAAIIDAKLGPPREPKLEGDDAFTKTNISPVPVVSWLPPLLGTPTDYEVQVYEVQVSGSALKFISTLRLATKQTSVRIPSGYLLGQRQYVFVIRARSRDSVDMYATPLRAGSSTSTAETLTALVTTDS